MISDTARVAALRDKLGFWETNLRANADHYAAEGRDITKLSAELDLIESVRDVVWPRCDACGRTDYDAPAVEPGSLHRCASCVELFANTCRGCGALDPMGDEAAWHSTGCPDVTS